MATGLRSRLAEEVEKIGAKQAQIETLGHQLAREKAHLAECSRRSDEKGAEIERLGALVQEHVAARLNARHKGTQIEKERLQPLGKAC